MNPKPFWSSCRPEGIEWCVHGVTWVLIGPRQPLFLCTALRGCWSGQAALVFNKLHECRFCLERWQHMSYAVRTMTILWWSVASATHIITKMLYHDHSGLYATTQTLYSKPGSIWAHTNLVKDLNHKELIKSRLLGQTLNQTSTRHPRLYPPKRALKGTLFRFLKTLETPRSISLLAWSLDP